MRKITKKFVTFLLLCTLFAAVLPDTSSAVVYADDAKKEIIFPGSGQGGAEACSAVPPLVRR